MQKFIIATVLAETCSCTYKEYKKLSYVSVGLYNIYIYMYIDKSLMDEISARRKIYIYVYIHTYTYIYRVSQEERT
jgi:hypothetical protein